MRKILYFLGAFVVVASALVSCGGGSGTKHATAINLPDSTLIGKSLPQVEGSLSEYISIEPEGYVLNLTDSILQMNVKVKVIKTFVPNQYMSATIANGDSLACVMPYIMLVDSVGGHVGNFYMAMDSVKAAELMTLINGKEGEVTEITFTAPASLTPGQCDTLAMSAVNFNLIGNLSMKADENAINAVLNRLAAAKARNDSWYIGGGGVDPVQMRKAAAGYASAKAAAKAVVPYMNDAQKAKYRSLDGN